MSAFVVGVLNSVSFADTNMRRVLHRLFFGVDVPSPTSSEREILDLAKMLVPPGRGWEWNQALMEFGALHCTARKPLCETCALNAKCDARPEIWDALAGLPRRAKREPGCRYEDSNRFYRGRVLAKLRDASEEGVELRSLGAELREGFADEDVPWIYGIVRSLEKDGLATVSGEVPAYAIGAVAEERAGYGTEEDGEPKETRVRLP